MNNSIHWMPDKKYPPVTARSIATTAFPRAKVGDTVRNIEDMLAEKSKELETIDHVYVVDENEVLPGVTSIREIHCSASLFTASSSVRPFGVV